MWHLNFKKNYWSLSSFKKWNDYIGWGRSLYLDHIWVWNSKEGYRSRDYFTRSFEWGGPKRKKIMEYQNLNWILKKNAFFPEYSHDLMSSLLGIFLFFCLFLFCFLRGPHLLHSLNLKKICLLSAIFILSKQSLNLHVWQATDWICHQLFWGCSCVM